MNSRLPDLLVLLSGAVALGGILYEGMRIGRNLRRYGDRRRLQHDLYRLTVTILTAFALYLLAVHALPGSFLLLPAPLLLFLVTVLPTALLCLLSGRWYLGYAAVLLVQGCALRHLQGDVLHGSLSTLLLLHALLDLPGLLVRPLTGTRTRTSQQK